MVYPGNNKLVRLLFGWYLDISIKFNLRRINYNAIAIDPSRSVLLLANHYSFWDTLLVYYLNKHFFKKKTHVLIIEKTMQRWPFLRHMGAFSITPNSKDMLASLNYAGNLLNDPGNLVLIYPQGKLYSNFSTEIIFEQGLSRVIQQSTKTFQCVMMASFIENFEHKKPGAYIYLKSTDIASDDIKTINQLYQQHYTEAKAKQTQIVV